MRRLRDAVLWLVAMAIAVPRAYRDIHDALEASKWLK